MTHLVASIVVLMVFIGCAQAKPDASGEIAPEGQREGVRTLQREPVQRIEADERFFAPFMLAADAPGDLKEAYKAFASGRTQEARKGLEAFLARAPNHALTPRASFLLAHVDHDSKRHKEAAARFEAVARSYPLLADHASYYGARSAADTGDHDKAIELSRKVDVASPFFPRSRLLRARSLAATGQRAEAMSLLDGLHKEFPTASFAGQVKYELASVMEAEGHYANAARLYHEVRTRYPGSRLEAEAEQSIRRVRPRLSRQQIEALLTLSPGDRVLRASALNDVHRSEQVVEEMTALLAEEASGLKVGDAVWCEANNLQATAWRKLRKHAEAAESFGRFIDACPGGDIMVQALYNAGRSLWTVDRDEEAVARFEKIWADYPSHSYADDAVLYAAQIRQSQNKGTKANALLDFQVKTFPTGDMLGTAHWMRFVEDYRAGRFEEAIDYVDGIGERTGESDIYTRGRLRYFRARALEQRGQTSRAAAGFAEVVRSVPMSYYALLSLNKLLEIDKDAFEALVKQIADADAGTPTWTIEPPQLVEDSRFKRGVELLRLGLFSDASLEFDQLRQGHQGHEKVLWTLTLLFDRAGAHHLSHNIPRREIDTFGTSYPVGPDKGAFMLAYPQPYLESASAWAGKREIPTALVYAIMREESGFNPRIESWANAYGLMQLILPTAKDMAVADGLKRPAPSKLRGRDLLDPETNIQLGTRFLASLHQTYSKHLAITISGYNGGFGNVDRWLKERGAQPLDLWIEDMPFGQTRNYTKRVLTSLWIYHWLYELPEGDVDATDRIVQLPMKLPVPSK